MLAFLKLIRFPNLLIIAFTQYAMRWGIIYPMLENVNKILYSNYPEKITNPHILSFQLTEFQFFLLVLSTVMIAAAGYIINDYFDTRIDRINRPEEVIIDRYIKRRVAMGAHLVINLLGVGIGAGLAWKLGMWKLGTVFVICAGALWYYSTTFKRQLLLGNIIIALLTGLVPLMVGLFEIPLLVKKYQLLIQMFSVNFGQLFIFIAGFSFFAFITTLIREIIKDTEDMQGDDEYGRDTLPLAYGLTITKTVLAVLILITMGLLGWLQYTQWQAGDSNSFYYLLLAVQLPFAFLLYRTGIAKEPAHFRFNHIFIKLIMIAGVLYTGVIFYSLV